MFGYTLEAERAFALLQNLGIVFALYTLTRPWGRTAAVGAGVVAALLTMTPIGLAALAWHGAVALALWAAVFAIRARNTGAVWSWAVAGLLGGFALSFRPDIVIAVSLTILAAGWAHRRVALRPVLIGAFVGLIPMWVHLVIAGPGPVIDGIVIDPVVRLRPGSGTSEPAVVRRDRRGTPGRRRGGSAVLAAPGAPGESAAVLLVLRGDHHRDRRAGVGVVDSSS